MTVAKDRLDNLLVARGLAPSRARAQCQELGKHFTGGLDCVAFRLPIFT